MSISAKRQPPLPVTNKHDVRVALIKHLARVAIALIGAASVIALTIMRLH